MRSSGFTKCERTTRVMHSWEPRVIDLEMTLAQSSALAALVLPSCSCMSTCSLHLHHSDISYHGTAEGRAR